MQYAGRTIMQENWRRKTTVLQKESHSFEDKKWKDMQSTHTHTQMSRGTTKAEKEIFRGYPIDTQRCSHHQFCPPFCPSFLSSTWAPLVCRIIIVPFSLFPSLVLFSFPIGTTWIIMLPPVYKQWVIEIITNFLDIFLIFEGYSTTLVVLLTHNKVFHQNSNKYAPYETINPFPPPGKVKHPFLIQVIAVESVRTQEKKIKARQNLRFFFKTLAIMKFSCSTQTEFFLPFSYLVN